MESENPFYWALMGSAIDKIIPREIQKSFFFFFLLSKQSVSQAIGHNGFEDTCKAGISPIITYCALPSRRVTPGSNKP